MTEPLQQMALGDLNAEFSHRKMVLDKANDVSAEGGDAVIEEAGAYLMRLQITVLENELGELIVESGPPNEVVDEFVSGSLVTIIFGSVTGWKR
jgi:hypothetical protein